MKKILIRLCLVVFSVTVISGCTQAKTAEVAVHGKVMSKSETELRLSMGKLWASRAILLREFIVSAINDTKDADDAKAKLLKNSGDLGAAIKPYYGYLAGGILAGFLKNDVALTGKVVIAAKIGDKKKLDAVKKKWYLNAKALAVFFAIPRNQTVKDLTDMLYRHQDLKMAAIDAILAKDVVKELDYCEKDRAHMLMFSDVLTDGIVKEFPKKFANK